jgi:hypothetical protein
MSHIMPDQCRGIFIEWARKTGRHFVLSRDDL